MYPSVCVSTVVLHSSRVSRSISHNILRSSLSDNATYLGLIISTSISPTIFAFQYLLIQDLSVGIGVEKKNQFILLIIGVIIFSLLLHQKYESIVEGSERISNIFVLLSEAYGNSFLMKHRINSIK